MEAVAFSEAQRSLGGIIERACRDRIPIEIMREDGQNVVLVPLDEYKSQGETFFLLASRTNARRLLDAIESLEAQAPRAS